MNQIQIQIDKENLNLDSFVVDQIKIMSRQNQQQKNGVHLEIEPIDLELGDHITAMDYLMEREVLLVGTLNGYLLLYIENWKATEVIGRVEGGVENISPSPDGALLAMITGLGQILKSLLYCVLRAESKLAKSKVFGIGEVQDIQQLAKIAGVRWIPYNPASWHILGSQYISIDTVKGGFNKLDRSYAESQRHKG
ncbi:hypothetical protein GIB67_017471 [Kingdonia uniflora]|uniref:ELP1 first N-terminal beta-propeller domain-containing protein n=1 Tax=Kingdonia uniflora TaxID=39325 RepID=A0A7J7M4P0_9MAGN|nr:hypothetical protein GIB67_017471 [Kingdonia uniflora]